MAINDHNYIHINFTDEFYKNVVKKDASKLGLPISEYIRQLMTLTDWANNKKQHYVFSFDKKMNPEDLKKEICRLIDEQTKTPKRN